MRVERHLDKVFADAANERAKEQMGRKFKYTLYKDAWQTEVISEGICEVTGRHYDSYVDCDIITITDLDTGERYSKNQFAIDLEEVA